MEIPASVIKAMSERFEIVPTQFFWFQVNTSKGPMVLLVCITPSGMQGYFMPPVTAKEVSEGLAEKSTAVQIAKQMPTLTPQDEAWLRDKDPKGQR